MNNRICELLNIKGAMARRILKRMTEEKLIVRKGTGKNTHYTILADR